MNFPEKLQKLRKERGWSQEELANRITVSRQAVSKCCLLYTSDAADE